MTWLLVGVVDDDKILEKPTNALQATTGHRS